MLAQVIISGKTYELKNSFLPPASMRDGYDKKVAIFASAISVEENIESTGISSQGMTKVYKFFNGQNWIYINESFINA